MFPADNLENPAPTENSIRRLLDDQTAQRETHLNISVISYVNQHNNQDKLIEVLKEKFLLQLYQELQFPNTRPIVRIQLAMTTKDLINYDINVGQVRRNVDEILTWNDIEIDPRLVLILDGQELSQRETTHLFYLPGYGTQESSILATQFVNCYNQYHAGRYDEANKYEVLAQGRNGFFIGKTSTSTIQKKIKKSASSLDKTSKTNDPKKRSFGVKLIKSHYDRIFKSKEKLPQEELDKIFEDIEKTKISKDGSLSQETLERMQKCQNFCKNQTQKKEEEMIEQKSKGQTTLNQYLPKKSDLQKTKEKKTKKVKKDKKKKKSKDRSDFNYLIQFDPKYCRSLSKNGKIKEAQAYYNAFHKDEESQSQQGQGKESDSNDSQLSQSDSRTSDDE